MAKKTYRWQQMRRGGIRRKAYSDKQRAAYWKKKYLKCMEFINSL